MKNGKIGVTTENIFPVIKKFLYSDHEIFLRELISNAVDATQKLKTLSSIGEAKGDLGDVTIRVAADKEKKTLTVTDRGVGMTAEEVDKYINQIAFSGAEEFMEKYKNQAIIGHFGLGFYSAFMVSDKVEIFTKSYKEGSKTVHWSCTGSPEFEMEETDEARDRGTTIVLHLSEDSLEYAEDAQVEALLKKYCRFLPVPIAFGKVKEWKDGKYVDTDKDNIINNVEPLWTRKPADITEEQYKEFYKAISHDSDDPLTWSHNRVEGNTEYTQLLYIPAKAPFDLYHRDKKAGVKLYVKRVFIMDDADALMPGYLRFVKGVIDSADLPLNVSRELLQESRDVKLIRDGSVKRVLGMLEDLAKHDKHEAATDAEGVTDVVSEEDKAKEGKYSQFYAEFGAVLKEGLGEDFANKERISKLLRFASTTSDTVSVSLADYKARMKEGQEAIYYITAETLAAAKNSPQLEVFKKKGIEVLLMTDRVDEWALNYLTHFDGTPLQSVAKGAVDLGKLQDEAEKKAAEAAAEAFKPVLAKLKEALKDKAEDVRVTTRLVDSPACLVVTEDGMSTQLARMLKQAGQTVPQTKPVLEVNPEHALVKKLDGSVHFHDLAHILFDQALLAEGGIPEDPAAYVKRVNALLV